tara:strand:- start:3739 stop:4845 length:1107 start_codon:yes stop_codon:yes gene_type:complete
MNPKINNISEIDDTLTFTLSNTDVSIANAIRRTLLSDIPCIVFKTIPYNDTNVIIEINTTNFNNEFIKQRLSCIPIHIDDIDFPIDDYRLEIDVKNDTDEIKYITTEDFKIKNIKLNNYLATETVKKIFPPNSLTKYYIDLVRLNPKISSTIPGGYLKLNCNFSIGTAGEEGMFNVVSTASYKYTQDPGLIMLEWEKIEEKLKVTKSKEEIDFYKKDWLNLDAKRLYIKNSFDFVIETIGIYNNFKLIELACEVIIKKLVNLGQQIKNNPNTITESFNTMDNCYDIILENEDYTIGKIVEYILFKKYFTELGELSYCGFIKEHPHNKNSIIRIAFKNIVENNNIISIFSDTIKILIEILSKIKDNFNN